MNYSFLYIILIAFLIALKDTILKVVTDNMSIYTIFYITTIIVAILATIFIVWYKPKELLNNLSFSNIGMLSVIGLLEMCIALGIIYLISKNNISILIPSLVSFVMIFTFVAGTCILKENFTFQKLIGLILGLFGVVLLNYNTDKPIVN